MSNIFNKLHKRKKSKLLLISLITILFLYLVYSVTWHLRYPIQDWQVYSNPKLGISFKHPSNLRIVSNEGFGYSNIDIADEHIKHPERVWDPEDVAYLYKTPEPCGEGGCGFAVITKGFTIRISRVHSHQFPADVYVETTHRKSTPIQLGNHKAYWSGGYVFIPGKPALGKYESIELGNKGDEIMDFTIEFPVNEKMYSRLLEQMLSTVEITNF